MGKAATPVSTWTAGSVRPRLPKCARSDDARFRVGLAASVAVLANNLQAVALRVADREGAFEERCAILVRAPRSWTGWTETIAFVA